MVGAVIITHGRLAEALVQAAEAITGRVEGITTITVDSSDTTDGIKEVLSGAIKSMESGGGVVILTDMFGGTPTNMALPFMQPGKVEVLTGVNLPMVLKYITHRSDKRIEDLAVLLKDYAQKSIVLAGDMLREKK